MPDLRNLREMPPEELVQVLFTWYQACRRLGFTRDEIYARPNILDAPTGFIGWGISVQAQGLEFNVTLGKPTESDDMFAFRWNRFAENEQSKISESELKKWWEMYMPVALFSQLGSDLVAKGFQLPAISRRPSN